MRYLPHLSVAATSLLFACSSGNEDTTGSGGSAGADASGGAAIAGPGSGGIPLENASGGSNDATGGIPDQPTGGALNTGGAPNTGGAVNTGGTPDSSGGAVNTGGTPDSSGGAGSGGSVASPNVCTVPTTLEEAGACNNVLVGAALASSRLGEAAYATAAREHNYATPENEMKWDTVQGSSGQFNFGPGDQIVNFAEQNELAVKGHTLVWHSQLPAWVNNLTSESAVRSAMLGHIETVVEHFKGKVVAWDVVNEALDVDIKDTGNGNPRFRDTVFYRYLGEGYIDEAFQKAHEIDPDVKLFYNDFGADGLNDKSDMMYELVSGMLERGVPIDGVGLQMHIGKPNPSPTVEEVDANIRRLTELGLEVQISELDINGCDGFSDEEQAALYYGIVASCVKYPLCTAVTMWGITDKYSWVNGFNEAGCNGQSARALLWDDNYQKKSSYDSVMQALTGH